MGVSATASDVTCDVTCDGISDVTSDGISDASVSSLRARRGHALHVQASEW